MHVLMFQGKKMVFHFAKVHVLEPTIKRIEQIQKQMVYKLTPRQIYPWTALMEHLALLVPHLHAHKISAIKQQSDKREKEKITET